MSNVSLHYFFSRLWPILGSGFCPTGAKNVKYMLTGQAHGQSFALGAAVKKLKTNRIKQHNKHMRLLYGGLKNYLDELIEGN